MLARSLAQCGKKVLLVDADLRSPGIGLQMGLEPSEGLMEVLTNQVDRRDVIVQTETPRLSILPAGRVDARVDPELITNGLFGASVSQWRRDYDVVLMDSPPVLPVADARILAGQADGTVLVVRAERTPRSNIFEAMRHLDSAGAALWGTIFIAPGHRRGPYARSYGYGYGYGASR